MWLGRGILLIFLLGIVTFGAYSENLSMINAFGTVFMYAILAQAWNILGGYGGYLNFGMVTFFGIGAYTTALLFFFYKLSPFITAPVAGLVAAVVGFVIGVPTLRLRGAYFAIVTMIITFSIQIFVLDMPFTQGALGIYLDPLPVSPLELERLFYFMFFGLALLVTLIVYAIEHSNFGWGLVAIREDEDAAEIVGVRTTEVKWVANVLASCIAGIVGGLYAQRIMYLEPIGTFSFDISLNVVLMSVIGGPGTWQGPLIGAPIVLLVADMLRVTVTSEVNRTIFSIIVIFVALFVPGGIMGLVRKIQKRRKIRIPGPTTH
jgi:branched-chain amino acid transport system permease protein